MKKLLLLLAIVFVAAACGSPVDASKAPADVDAVEGQAAEEAPAEPAPERTEVQVEEEIATEPDFPATVAGAEIPQRPTAIVSLSPTATETLFAIGAGEQVIAVDTLSNFPASTPLTDLSAFEPNVEAIAALEPDLVVISWDPGELVSGLNALGIPIITHQSALTFDDAYTQIMELGDATGNASAATELIVRMQAEIAAALDEIEIPDVPIAIYHEVDDTLYSASSNGFIGSIYSLFGVTNIADEADPDGWGFPQLSAEYVIEANPDLIFYGCGLWCGTTAETISQRAGWDGISAVQNQSMFELDDDVTSRWGPRLVDFVRLIGESLASAQ